MAKTKIDFRTAVPTAYQKPLYATVGAGDLAVTAVREYVADVQQRITEVQKDVETRVSDVQTRVSDVQKSVTKLTPSQVRARVEARVAELQDEAVTTYGDLAKRGEAVVKGTKLPSTATAQAGENGVEVKVNTTNPAARKTTTTRKPAAKKAPAKKAPAKKAPARKTTAKKAPASTKA
ncbi:hypothetical protein [Nocardioides litoris]|uniref:hypothetical protein n=1 Tax=Nocardioides litoris TaxID=1926648 RepID=UPI00111DEE77|nr:hypothetical protein [Nocardioides litoris]